MPAPRWYEQDRTQPTLPQLVRAWLKNHPPDGCPSPAAAARCAGCKRTAEEKAALLAACDAAEAGR